MYLLKLTFEFTNETMGSISAITNFPALRNGTLPVGAKEKKQNPFDW